MSKHLVTGAAGFIGSHLCRRLVGMGHEVIGVDNLSSGSRKNVQDLFHSHRHQFVLVNNDLRDFSCCTKVMEGVDYVWALAATMGGILFITSVHADIMRDNALINLNTLEAARLKKVKKYFYSSSACIYPSYLQTNAGVKPLKESDAYPCQPDESYGFEKIFTEQVCKAYQKDYKMNIRIARFHNIFGGDCFTAFDKLKAKAPCHMIIKAIKHPNPPFVIWGKGDATRSFLYIDDCIDGILKLMESDYPEPINIGSDRLISVDDLAKSVIDISEKKIVPKHDLTKPEGVKGRNADLTLVKQVLGWQPKISLEEGLKRSYVWAEKHLSGLENI